MCTCTVFQRSFAIFEVCVSEEYFCKRGVSPWNYSYTSLYSARTKMRCCDLFFKVVAKRSILVAVCTAIFALFLSMVGMSKFEIATEVKTGRDEYSPEGSKFTQRNDAVTLSRKELERPLPVQDQQSITSDEFRTNFLISWLSSNPTPKFPISILQMGIKMTTEPPRGLKANLKRLYLLIPENRFDGVVQKSKFKKLLFSLCWFHSILLERRKFKSLGFCIPYVVFERAAREFHFLSSTYSDYSLT